jgi:hypothetical protein
MNDQEMNLQLRQAIRTAKKRLVSEYTADDSLSVERQTEQLLEMESDLLAEEMTKVFVIWLGKIYTKIESLKN